MYCAAVRRGSMAQSLSGGCGCAYGVCIVAGWLASLGPTSDYVIAQAPSAQVDLQGRITGFYSSLGDMRD